MWTAVKTGNFAVAICNFDGKVKHGLPIMVGDVVEILEECAGWYHGKSFRAKSEGIFPVSHVVLRDYELDGNGHDAVPVLVEDIVASEVCHVLREWNSILKIQFLENQRSLVKTLGHMMSELVSLRKILLTEKFASGHMNETKSQITRTIDKGNKRLGLDLVPRLNNEPVDFEKADPIELFRIHENSSLSSERNSEKLKTDTGSLLMTHHFAVRFNSIGFLLGEDLEFHFALFDSQVNEFFTERFLLKVDKKGAVTNCDNSRPMVIFMDLGDKDFHRDAYLVVQMFRMGSLRDSSGPSKTPTLCYKRPHGCGVCSISNILKNKNKDEPEDIEALLRIFSCSESEFSQFHENLIRKPTPSNERKIDVGFSLSLWLMHCNLEAPLAADLHLMKNAILTNKIGFSDVIMPDTDRNDLYLTIQRGEFERGSKTSQKNVEVRVLVLAKDGKHVEKCISGGTGEPDANEYTSYIFYHMNNARWNDTIRLRIPVDQFSNSHVRIEFRHISNKDKTEKKLLGMCFVRLITDEFTTLADGPRELCFYKFDDARKLQDPREYISLPDVSTMSQMVSTTNLNSPPFRRSDKEAVYISTKLCSTKFTQNVILLGILNWKLDPFKVNDYLKKFILQDGEEIVKFLQWLMDALFDMMSSENSAQIKPMFVFKALIHVFHLLKDERFERFLPVMDAYISNNFSACFIYQELAKRSVEILEGVVALGIPVNSRNAEQRDLMAALSLVLEDSLTSPQHQILKSLQVLKSIFKCLVQSRLLYLNCQRSGDREKDELSEILNDFLGAMMRALSVDNAILIKLQVAILHQVPEILLELSKLVPPVNLCHTFCKLISSVSKTSHKELITGKLDCLRMMVLLPSLVSAYECKSVLVPFYVLELSHFLQVERDASPVADILMEVMTSMHCDCKLNVPLTPNLSVILDGLLEEILNFINVDNLRSLPSSLIVCLTSMLQLMDEQHFKQLLVRYEERHLLEPFLDKMLVTMCNLSKREFYPSDWLVMKMVTNQAVLQTIKLISAKLKEKFLDQKLFNRMLWSNFFHFAVTFVTQPCLQLEHLSSNKRHRLIKRHGDLRLKMVHEFLQNWKSLNQNQIHFVPEFVGPFLEMALIPEPNVRKSLMPIFFEMMLREWENSNSFSKLENELIDQLDILVNNNKADEDFKKLFHSVLLGKVQNNLGWSDKWKELIESATSLLDVLLDYRNVLALQDSMESQMKCISNLLHYYSSIVQRQEKYVHYVYLLYDLHVACGNHTEAAMTLKLHSNLLCWNDEMLPKFGSYQAQFGWQRLEKIYETAVAEFDFGKMWEYGLPLLEKLADVYKEKIMYSKLSKQLKLQADFYQKILGDAKCSGRFEPTYFLVRFFGLGFSSFLRDKEFIYRGNECEKLIPFQYRFQEEFSGATVLDHMNVPPNNIKQGPGRYLQICVVTPLPVIDARFMMWNVPDPVRSFYRTNNVDEFYFDRPFHQGAKDANNDFKTLSCERFIMKTSEKFPGVMRWFEVTSLKKSVLSPTEVAIDAITKKNEDLNMTLSQFHCNSSQNLNPLTMRLKGVLDAPVMGGFPKYQEAFFNKEFQKRNPQNNDKLCKLLELFTNQISILEKAMHLHKQLAPTQLQRLHEFLEEKFETLKQQIHESGRLIGFVSPRGQSQGTVKEQSQRRKDEPNVLPAPNEAINNNKPEEDRAKGVIKITNKKLGRESSGILSPLSPVGTKWYQDPSANTDESLTAFTDDSKKTNNKELEVKMNPVLHPKHRTDAQPVTMWKTKNAVSDCSLPAFDSNSASSSHALRLENVDSFIYKPPPILRPDLKTPPSPVARARSSKLGSLDSRNSASSDIFNRLDHLNCSSHLQSVETTATVDSKELKSKMDASKISFTSGTDEKPIVKLRQPPSPRIAHLPLTIMPPKALKTRVSKVDQIETAENKDTPMHKPVAACTSVHESDLERTCVLSTALPSSVSVQIPGPAQTSEETRVQRASLSVKDKMKLFNC